MRNPGGLPFRRTPRLVSSRTVFRSVVAQSFPPRAAAMHSASSFSFFTVCQYAFLALVAYVLAGAPLQEMLFSGARSQSYSYSTGAGVSGMSPQKLDSLVVPDGNLTCEERAFGGVHVLSREPLVVYIEGFLRREEADEVVELR